MAPVGNGDKIRARKRWGAGKDWRPTYKFVVAKADADIKTETSRK
jgi:hypothetical protein